MAELEQPTFGRILAEARHRAGLNLREAAELIRKPGGEAVSFQYLSELENDHRNPPSEHLLDEIARVYKITRSYLYIQAGRIPPDFPRRSVKEPQADAIFQELRRIVEQSAAA